MLTLDNVTITQGDFRLDANLALPPGTSIAIMGPSGSGKSTLLNVIAGFLAPQAGRVLWHGDDITAQPPGARPLSILFQDGNLFPHLTAEQNVALGITPSGRLTPAQRDAVTAALARVGLAERASARPADLSGGQQSRVALARMLVRDRPLVLLDEAFSALGPALKAEMLTLLRDLTAQSGATLLMVTHDPEDARLICPETVVVEGGKAHPPQATGALLDNPTEGLARYLGTQSS